jgi:hypothetical protein
MGLLGLVWGYSQTWPFSYRLDLNTGRKCISNESCAFSHAKSFNLSDYLSNRFRPQVRNKTRNFSPKITCPPWLLKKRGNCSDTRTRLLGITRAFGFNRKCFIGSESTRRCKTRAGGYIVPTSEDGIWELRISNRSSLSPTATYLLAW